MSDTPLERDTDSKTNLIEVQHVGVTAQLQSPLKHFMQQSSSSANDTEPINLHHKRHDKRAARYHKFSNDTQMDTTTTTTTTTTASTDLTTAAGSSTDYTTTECSKLLYEMHATHRKRAKKTPQALAKQTPTKIEFQLYQRPHATAKRCKRKLANAFGGALGKRKHTKHARRVGKPRKHTADAPASKSPTLMQRLRHSLRKMQEANAAHTYAAAPQSKLGRDERIPEDGTEANVDAAGSRQRSARESARTKQKRYAFNDIRLGIYPFEHGCAEYLRTTDAHPEILSIALAERATMYATRFWAEFFGTLHIGVTFIVTFLLQTYRFLLFTLINTLLVGFLHMTSDYLIKPLLTVLFNGYLQPPMIFLYNILASLRDLLTPIAETINNFMQPVATVGRSFRLINIKRNNTRKYMKEV